MASRTSYGGSLNRVYGPSLSSEKHWYVVTKQLCGVRATDFAKNEIFRLFPSEIQCVTTDELRSTTNLLINKQPRTFVVTSFGLCTGLLRVRGLPNDGFIASSSFNKVLSAVNSIQLEFDGAKIFGGNACKTDPNVIRILELETEIDLLNQTIEEFKTSPQSSKHWSSLPSTPPSSKSKSSTSSLASSSPSSSPHSSLNSRIEETVSSPVGSTTKKRKVSSLCQKAFNDLEHVCGQHSETLPCVFGNGFVFGGTFEKEKIRNTISTTIDIVMTQEGSSRNFNRRNPSTST